MTSLEPLIENISTLTPLSIGLVALAGLVVGVSPSSFPLISVAAGFFAGRHVKESGTRANSALWLTVGFVLGIVTVDAIVGALFGLAGFAVMRILMGFLPFAFALFAVILAVVGLALLRVIHVTIPVLNLSPRPVRGFLGSYLLGLPFGLSTCPACTPLMLPVVIAAAGTADPLLGGTLLAAFGLARGVPIMVTGTAASFVKRLSTGRRYITWIERAGGALVLAAALYFAYQSAVYAGWAAPM